MPFTFKPLDFPDVILIEPKIFEDERGVFLETFKVNDFKVHGIPSIFLQDNYSKSKANVLRGLHFQANPHAQGKLVYVPEGSIFDVVVDIRKSSPTYGQWTSAVLSGENHHMLWVPPGYAHGFCVLSDSADVIYKCTQYYHPASDRGICWNDTDLQIAWPIKNPIISAKDITHPRLCDLTESDLLEYVV